MLYVLLAGCALVLSATASLAPVWEGLPPAWILVRSPYATVLCALALPILYVSLCAWSALHAVRAHDARNKEGSLPHRTHDLSLDRYQRMSNFARILLIAGFAFLVFFTHWPVLLLLQAGLIHLPLVASLTVLSPFLLAVVLGWVVQWPADRLLREAVNADLASIGRKPSPAWTFRTYLTHHLRQNLLFVLVPMSAILLVSDLMLVYGRQLRAITLPLPWLDEPLPLRWLDQAAIGLTTFLVFLVTPLLIRWLWITTPLEKGALRFRLEQIARQHGMRFRDILVWQAGPGLANAAVIGVFAPLRYVLISEGLLEGMSPRQVEGVFGHELGHLVYHHIVKLVACSLATMIAVGSLLMGVEWGLHQLHDHLGGYWPWWLARGGLGGPWLELGGLLLVGWVWYQVFGRLSRLYERQADVFGALQIDEPSPGAGQAEAWQRMLHNVEQTPVLASAGLVGAPGVQRGKRAASATELSPVGAKRFAGTLELVGYLNGMDPHHFDWRHGTLHQREEHLHRLAENELFARTFDARIRRVNRVLWLFSGVSLTAAGWYYLFWA